MRLCRILTLLLLIFLSSSISQALETGLAGTDLQLYRPAVDSFGLFGVNGPRLQRAGEYHLQLSQSFAFGPLFGIAVNGVPVDLVGRVFTTDVVASVGLASFLTVAIDLPLHLYAREADFNTLAPFTTQSVGDLSLSLKWRLLEEGPRRPGLALLVSSTFPTGNDGKFLGSQGAVPSVDLIVGKEWRNLRLAANVGGRFVPRRDVLGLVFDDRITYGAGFAVPIRFIDPAFSFLGEIRGHFQPGQVALVTAPVEFEVGLRKDFRNGLSMAAAAGGGWNNAVGNPRVRGLFSISWSPAVRKALTVEEPPHPVGRDSKPDKIRTTVYFRRGSSSPTAESAIWAREAGTWLKKKPRQRVVVEGHTDTTERSSLSRRRAETVRDLMVREGAASDRIEVRFLGASRPVVSGKEHTNRILNRRVEIMPTIP